jgi:ornithine cyclodeaminase/alanine dehydrogenase-like protein (mu-crystallin family)
LDDLIERMQSALVQYSAGRCTQPVRTVLPVQQAHGFFGLMPACLPDLPALGCKLVTVYEGNRAAGLPSHLATIALLDPDTGEMLALLDGRYITEARTAAVSAVATRLLARDDPMKVAMIGSGVQARSHLDALNRIRILREVRAWSPDSDRLAAFVREMRPRVNGTLVAAASAEDAVRGADIVVLVTSSTDPVVRGEWVAEGAHVCAVGACRPTWREMDTALVARSRLFVDSRAGALAEAGDIVIPIAEGAFGPDHIVAELGEVAAGTRPGRSSRQDVTLFKSLGMAVEDVAAAHLAYQRAVGRGLGRGFVL